MNILELKKVSPREFYCAVGKSSKSWMITPYTPGDFWKMTGVKLYLISNNSAGFGIKADGELICLFNESGVKGLGKVLIAKAIKLGANNTFSFDGFMTKFNSQFGFVEYKREPWNPEFAPKNWPDNTRPDVVYMRLKDIKTNIFECRVYDSDGNLKEIHTAEELEERSRQICLSFLPDNERKVIESFGG